MDIRAIESLLRFRARSDKAEQGGPKQRMICRIPIMAGYTLRILMGGTRLAALRTPYHKSGPGDLSPVPMF